MLKALRSASERTNSSTKDDFCILSNPKIRGLKNAGVLAQMAVMVLLLKRISRFIVKVTLAMRKMFSCKLPCTPQSCDFRIVRRFSISSR